VNKLQTTTISALTDELTKLPGKITALSPIDFGDVWNPTMEDLLARGEKNRG
jgi:hypothetical protein